MAKRVFVAGAGGVIGRRLSVLLVREGWHVVGTTRSAETAEALGHLGIEPVVVDVFDADALREAAVAARPDAVIHQLTDLPAALDPSQLPQARIRNARLREVGTRNLIAAALAGGASRLIAQSVAFAYAPGPLPYREEAPLNVDAPADAGVSARGVASLEAQVLAAPLVGIVLRYGRLYGPGTGVDTLPVGGPVHVDAAAEAARLALTRGDKGIYNIAEDDGTVDSSKARAELSWDTSFRMR